MSAPDHGVSFEVVIPLRDMESHVEACLRPLLEQCRDGDVVTVVDDGSTDATPRLAADLGARVIRLAESGGPYAGRHFAAEQSDADVLLFVDGRSRALPGLLDSHRRQLSAPGVALSCTEVTVLAGTTFAGRIAAQQGIFSLDKYIGVPGRLDYFPTCNLGVLRTAYLAVGGFRRMRSGGDADLCWRIQEAGLGRLSYDSTNLMEWAPRETVRELSRQWRRYGESATTLRLLYPRERVVAQHPATASSRRGRARRLLGQAARDFPAAVMAVALELIMRNGAAQARRHPPQTRDLTLLGDAPPAAPERDPG